ncbi:hypothetical protein D3C74_491600 [compost metagenome]
MTDIASKLPQSTLYSPIKLESASWIVYFDGSLIAINGHTKSSHLHMKEKIASTARIGFAIGRIMLQ